MARRNAAHVPEMHGEVQRTLSVVVGLDAHTFPQFQLTHQTWRKFWPELWDMQWLIFHDWSMETGVQTDVLAEFLAGAGLSHASVMKWPVQAPFDEKPLPQWPSQRGKMLAGFVHMPQHCNTPWWMKIDTDSICMERKDWIDPAHFEPDSQVRFNAYIASSWHYSKAKGGGGDIWDWVRALEQWGDQFSRHERLELQRSIEGNKIQHKRMASWLSIYNTEWTRALAASCQHHCGAGQLPVPSQDTTAWYFAERRRDRYHTERKWGKRRGWTNVPGFEKLRQRVAEIMET